MSDAPAPSDLAITIGPMPSVIDRHQAAERLGTSERHVRHLTQTGQLTFVRIGGKQRFLEGDLAAFVLAHRVERIPPADANVVTTSQTIELASSNETIQ